MFPFRNIRDVLGLHAKASPHKPALISYDTSGQRETLSYLELVGKAHQIANLLYEDLAVKRGDTIAWWGTNHENLLLLHCAAWVVGANLISMDSPAYTSSGAQFAFVTQDAYAEALKRQIPSLEGIILLDGEAQAGIMRLEELAAHRPTTFLGDESGAKGADIPLMAANERSASLSDLALLAPALTQEDLLLAAQTYAQVYALTGNQTGICALPLSDSASFISSLFTMLLMGGTVVLLPHFEPALFWRAVVQERANTVTLGSQEIRAMLESAENNLANGQTLFGQKITLQDAKHFRHILCLDTSLTSELASAFENRFGLSIQLGYAHAAQLLASLPINLPWREHQAWLHSESALCIGNPIPPWQLAVLDEAGHQLGENTVGQLAYRHSNQNWQHSQQAAFFRHVPDGQAYFFLYS